MATSLTVRERINPMAYPRACLRKEVAKARGGSTTIQDMGNDFLVGLVDAYAEHLMREGKTRVSVLAYLNPNRKLIQYVKEKGVRRPKQITPKLLKEFQGFFYTERDFKPGTIKTFFHYIGLFFDFLVEQGHVRTNPTRNVRILPKPELVTQQLSHFYTFDEVLRRYSRSQEAWVSYSYLNNVQKHLKGFFKYLRAHEVGSLYPVTEAILIQYRDYLWDEFVHARKDSLVVKSQIERLRCVVRLFRYLEREGIIIKNPTVNLSWEAYYKDLIQKEKSLPEKPKPEYNLTELDRLNLKFLEYEEARGKDLKTRKIYKKGIEIFFDYMKSRGLENMAQVTKRVLLDYFLYLSNYIGVRGKPVSNHYKNQILWSLKLFYRFLVRFDYLPKDLTLDLESVKEDRGLPHSCMNEREVFQLLDKPHMTSDPLVTRDKAMIGVLFSTGLRSNELCSLNIEDIDHKEEMVRVNNPKGGNSQQRIVPIGRTALEHLNAYLKDARPVLENGDPKALFLSYAGHRIQTEAVLNMVKKYAHECGFRKRITTHSLRVTCGTLMLTNGADIRYVQEQLGHRRITSTQLYTRLVPKDLKSVHKRCHPMEKVSG